MKVAVYIILGEGGEVLNFDMENLDDSNDYELLQEKYDNWYVKEKTPKMDILIAKIRNNEYNAMYIQNYTNMAVCHEKINELANALADNNCLLMTDTRTYDLSIADDREVLDNFVMNCIFSPDGFHVIDLLYKQTIGV